MSDYYVGMKHETFLARNRNNIRHIDLLFDCEGGNALGLTKGFSSTLC